MSGEWRRRAPPGCRLSERQLQVASLLALGFTQDEIAGLLGIKPTTVRTHMVHARQKLGVHTTAALAAQVAVRWMTRHAPAPSTTWMSFDRRLAVVKARQRRAPRPTSATRPTPTSTTKSSCC